jgi:hypothetical protein
VGAALVGALGGWTGAQLQPTSYSATAYVVVYRMPAGLTNVISPGEATTLRSVYTAGVFQDAVIAKVLPYFPGLTVAEYRRTVQIEVVAYSPLTRVIVSASDPVRAVALANSVSDNWAGRTQELYEETFTALQQRLEGRKQSVDSQVAQLEAAIAAQQTARIHNPALVNALQTELAADQQQQQDLSAVLISLSTYHDKGESLAYTAVRASLGEVVASNGTLKTVAFGAVVGLTSGVLLAVWLLWRWRSALAPAGRRARSVTPITASTSEGRRPWT